MNTMNEHRNERWWVRLTWLLYGCVLVVLAVATWLEPRWGQQVVLTRIYQSVWLALLWAAVAVGGAWTVVRHRGSGSAPVRWMVHGALCTLLVGAAVSCLTAKEGRVRLRQGVAERAYEPPSGRWDEVQPLPFALTLVELQNAAQQTASYGGEVGAALVRVDDGQQAAKVLKVRPGASVEVDGWQLFFTAYAADRRGMTLSVRHDVVGRGLTYAAYGWLLVALILSLVSPSGGWRRVCRRVERLSARTGACCWVWVAVVAGLWATNVSATSVARERWVLTDAEADALGALLINDGNHITTVEAVAHDVSRRLTGRSSWGPWSAMQVWSGLIFFPDYWERQPIIKVGNAALARRLGVERWASVRDFVGNGHYRLAPYLQGTIDGGKWRSAAAEVDECLQLIAMLRSGLTLQLFPASEPPTATPDSPAPWLSPVTPIDTLRRYFNGAEVALIRDGLTRLRQAARQGDECQFLAVVKDMAQLQAVHGGATLLSASKQRWMHRYLAVDEAPTYLARTLFVWSLGLVLAGLWLSSRRQEVDDRWLARLARAGAWGVWALLTAFMALRCYVSGRLPVGSGHETMLLAAWMALPLALWAQRMWRVMPMAHGLVLLPAAFFLLVSALSVNGASTGALMPVLRSPLLTIHVSIIMLSYALLTFVALLSAVALCQPAQREPLKWHALALLYPATALLAVGIFVGAVWADRSWGRYWGWDPKEVWALITWMLYSLPLHRRLLPWLQRPVVLHAFLVAAFAAVLMTYFGVNYVLGGLHAYVG